MADAAGQPHSLEGNLPPLLSLTTLGEGGDFALQELPSFPSTYKAEDPEGQAFRAQVKHPAHRKALGILFPWFNSVPVPWQDSTSLPLSLCSGEAAQGAQTQHNSEELGGPGTPHSWCPAHYRLVSRNPPDRKAPLQALRGTRKRLGSARAQHQYSTACAVHKRELNTPLHSPS